MVTCIQIHNDYLIPGGETKSTNIIADLLESQGVRVIRYYKDNKVLASHSLRAKLKVGINSVYNRETIDEIQKILNENKVDFALIHNTSPIISNSVYDVLQNNNIKVFKYLQNYNMMCLNGALDGGEVCAKCKKHPIIGVKKKCYKESIFYSLQKYISALQLRKKYLSRIDSFIAISNYVKNQHVKFGIPEEKISVIHHFCEAEARIIANGQLKDDEKYIVYMGRLSKEKGIMTLVDAVRNIPGIKLKVLGKGEMESDIREYIRKYEIGNVELIGYKSGEEKDYIVGNAIALVAPSEWDEPFGRIVIEAYQVGTPVIASSMGGLVELVREGVTGYCFDAGNSSDLKKKICKIQGLSNNSLYEMRKACVEIVDNEFSKDAYYEKFINFINSQQMSADRTNIQERRIRL